MTKFHLLSSAVIAIVFQLLAVSQLAAAVEKGLTIVVDAGHGGRDPGMVSKELKESEVALTMAKELAGKLRQLGYKVVLTRNGDKFMPLRDHQRQTHPPIPHRISTQLLNLTRMSAYLVGALHYQIVVLPIRNQLKKARFNEKLQRGSCNSSKPFNQEILNI